MTIQNIKGTKTAVLLPAVSTPTTFFGGPYGWLTPYIAGIAAHNEAFAARVLLLRRDELHFIGLCLSLMGDARNDADHLGAFARGFGVVTRKTLLMNSGDLGGRKVCAGLAKIPAKLAGAPWRPASYARLADLMNETSARKTLGHLGRIKRRDVLTLGRLPYAYRTSGVLKLIKKPKELSEVLFAIEVVRRVRADLDDRQILASLEKVETSYLREWITGHYEHAPFPEAPVQTAYGGALVIGGVEALRPLWCYEDLARGAREFDNCIRTYLLAVLKGDTYFYRYAPDPGGKGIAIVELKRLPAVGWIVHEALGPKNKNISGVHRAAILAAFREIGIGAAPQASNPNAWLGLD
ncbi:MAG: hypothetical protein DHS20C05_04860 [Hyphococcus sp.]|nr:MAG: hypothetical protein DHS20C05_04860 [Marinicaulis sp.]